MNCWFCLLKQDVDQHRLPYFPFLISKLHSYFLSLFFAIFAVLHMFFCGFACPFTVFVVKRLLMTFSLKLTYIQLLISIYHKEGILFIIQSEEFIMNMIKYFVSKLFCSSVLWNCVPLNTVLYQSDTEPRSLSEGESNKRFIWAEKKRIFIPCYITV